MYIGGRKVVDIRIGGKRVLRVYQGSEVIYDSVVSIELDPDTLFFTPDDLRPKSFVLKSTGSWHIDIRDN